MISYLYCWRIFHPFDSRTIPRGEIDLWIYKYSTVKFVLIEKKVFLCEISTQGKPFPFFLVFLASRIANPFLIFFVLKKRLDQKLQFYLHSCEKF
jgi:hypothetical protein